MANNARPLHAIAANAPAEMRAEPRWVCWDGTRRADGRLAKTPLNPATGRPAQSNNPATWGTFNQACAYAAQHEQVGGVGFVLTGSRFWALDLDHVIDVSTGDVAPAALTFLNNIAPTYVEQSPSGDGLHIIFRGVRPAALTATRANDAFGQGKNLEVFGGSSSRYLTMTGALWSTDATPLAEAPHETIDTVLAMFPSTAPHAAVAATWTAFDEGEREVRRALRNVPADDYEQWIHVGMALHSQFDDATARGIWTEWSSKSAKFDEKTIEKHWRSFRDRPGGKTLAYIYWLAKQYEPNWWHDWKDTQTPNSSATEAPQPKDDESSKPTRGQLRLRLRPRSEILNLPPTRWLVRDYATCGSVNLLGADPNLGKSTLANAWAHCIWTQTQWLGHAVLAGSVLFVLGEDARGASLRAKAWEAEYGPIGPQDGRYIEYADRMPPLCEAAGQVELRRVLQFLLQEHGHAPALVVIDTLSTVWGSEPENAAELAAALMSVLSSLADEFGCTFLLIHHLNKVPPGGPKREITLSSIRGASAFAGSADDVLVLEAVDGGARLFGIKGRNTEKAPEKLLRVHKVDIGTNEDGDPVTSVILVEAPPAAVLSPEAMAKATTDRAWNAAEKRVQHAVDVLSKMGSARSRTAIANRMTGKRSERFAAIDDAMSRELIVAVGTKKVPKLVVNDHAKGGVCNTPHTPEPGTGNRSPADAGPGSVPSDAGTGSQPTGTGNRFEPAVDQDDGLPEKPKRRRKGKTGGA